MGSKSIRVGLYCLARSQFLNTYEHGVGIWGDIEQRECGLQQHRWNGEVGATGRWAAIASLEAPFSSVFGTRTLPRAIQPGAPGGSALRSPGKSRTFGAFLFRFRNRMLFLLFFHNQLC